MKKFLTYILLFAAMATTACNKLEIAPKDEMADKEVLYKNLTVTNQILTGIYSILYNEYTWGAEISIRMEAATDMALTRRNVSGSPENNSHTSQSAEVKLLWTALYQGINAANEFIYFCEKYTPTSAQKTQMLGEARFLRAYYYFTLVRLFGDVPFRTEMTTDINNTDIARTSAVKIYDFIVKELAEIQATLQGPTEVTYGHICNTAAQAALADVYLNMAGELMKNRMPADSTQTLMYSRAAAWCNKVLENPAHDITATPYTTVFLNQVQQVDNVKEQIWEIQTKYMRSEGYRCDNRIGKYNGIGSTISGVYGCGGYVYHGVALHNYYRRINDDDATLDVRYDWNCPWVKMGATSTWKNPVYVKVHATDQNEWQLFEGKWRVIYAPTAAECADVNYGGVRLSMYRIADVHLMYAEALNGSGGDRIEAVRQVNKVRARANATAVQTDTAMTQEEVFNLIVDERARELCFEGKRRFDLIRWGIYGTKMAEAKVYYLNPTNPNWVTAAMMAAFNNYDSSRTDILPIPDAEINRNNLINQADQNMGWGGTHKWK